MLAGYYGLWDDSVVKSKYPYTNIAGKRFYVIPRVICLPGVCAIFTTSFKRNGNGMFSLTPDRFTSIKSLQLKFLLISFFFANGLILITKESLINSQLLSI